MVDPKLRDDVMSDIVLLKIIGVNPVIVHGGGADINAALKHYDIPVEFRMVSASPRRRPWRLCARCWWVR